VTGAGQDVLLHQGPGLAGVVVAQGAGQEQVVGAGRGLGLDRGIEAAGQVAGRTAPEMISSRT